MARSRRSRRSPLHSRQVFGLYRHFGINDYPIDLAFHVTRWQSKHRSSARKTVAFNLRLTIKIRYPWIEALPSWLKCQFRQEEVRFLEYVRSSHVVLTFRCSCDAPSHSPRCSGRAHQRTHQLARPRVRSSMMRLMVVASRSKSRQKVEESSKSPKSLKALKNLQRPSVRRNVYRSTDPPSIENEELELPLQLSDSFSSSFC